MQTIDGRLTVIGGSSRSGKTAYTAKRVKGSRRVWAYDPEAQWCELRGWRKVRTRAELVSCAKSSGPQKVAFVPGPDLKADFDFFCQAAYFAGRHVAPLDVVAEELADVTSPSKAPGNWGILVRRGLKRGINIFALSQRWSEADKTAFGNASEFVFFCQSSAQDVAYIAARVMIPASEIEPLVPLEWIRWDKSTRQIDRGKLKF